MRTPLLVAAVIIGACARCPAQATFQGLGLLPGAATSESRLVSSDGSTVAGISTNTGTTQPRAFIWDAAGLQEMPPLPGATQNSPRALSLSGHHMIGTCGTRGYYWTTTGGLVELLVPGDNGNVPLVISGNGGSVSGTSASGLYRWTPATGFELFPIGTDDRSFGAPLGISDDGTRILGAVTGHSPYRAWIITPQGQEYLPDLGGPLGSQPTILSATGVALGRSHTQSGRMTTVRWDSGITPVSDESFWGVPTFASADSGTFVYTQGSLNFMWNGVATQLAPPAGASSVAVRGISGDGVRIWGTATRDAVPGQPWVWTHAGGAVWLADALVAAGANMTDWTIRNANAMSRDGTTWVGRATNPAGAFEAYRAVLPR
jgi:uncharacterized membrane protein